MEKATDANLLELGDIELSLGYIKVQAISPSSRILDIGTRHGSLVHALIDSGYPEVYGTDIDSQAIEKGIAARPYLRERIRVCEDSRIPFTDGYFDAITIFDVLEHIPDIRGYLQEVLRILKPGGIFIFQTPNRYINIPWEIIQYRSLTNWRQYHCSLQSLRSLRRLLTDAGLVEICIEKYQRESEYKYNLAKDKLGKAGPVLIKVASYMPLVLYPNFWGHAKKP